MTAAPKPVAEGWWGSTPTRGRAFWLGTNALYENDQPAVVLLKTEYDRLLAGWWASQPAELTQAHFHAAGTDTCADCHPHD